FRILGSEMQQFFMPGAVLLFIRMAKQAYLTVKESFPGADISIITNRQFTDLHRKINISGVSVLLKTVLSAITARPCRWI
ncbi:MAG: hypothetical protein K1V95_01935, partial [Eubacterium sp.]